VTTPDQVRITPAKIEHAIAESRRLTDRDDHVIRLLAMHRAMTAELLARIADFPNETRARHRLLLLFQRGVLARFRRCHRPGSLPWVYTLGLIGAAIHAAHTDQPLPRPAEITQRIVRLHYSRTLDHNLAVNDFFSYLAAHARHMPGCRLELWWSEAEAAQACGNLVRPDGYAEWTEHGRTLGFFLEHDTGHEPLRKLIEKINRYTELARAGISRPILFHLPSAAREANLHRAIARRFPGSGPPIPLATAIHAHSSNPSPAAPIWLPLDPGGDREPRHGARPALGGTGRAGQGDALHLGRRRRRVPRRPRGLRSAVVVAQTGAAAASPVLVGGSGPNVARRVLDFGDEWMPHAGMPPEELSARITALRRTARDADDSREVPVTVFGAEPEAAQLETLRQIGVNRAVLYAPPTDADTVHRFLDQAAPLVAKVRD
jgi:hypothetical protein